MNLIKSPRLLTSLGTAVALSLSALAAVPAQAQDSAFTTPEEKAGYSIGVNIGGNLVTQGLLADMDAEALLMGISDAMTGDLKMTEEEIYEALQAFTAMQQAKAEAAIAAENAANAEFLSNNAERDGLMITDSGLQYEVLVATDDASAAMPSETDTVTVHYHGTMVNGEVFDSSVDRGEPIEFPLNGVIPGWTEGLQLMQVGEKYRFFIPSELAYGASGAGPIPPNATLIFDVELLGIE